MILPGRCPRKSAHNFHNFAFNTRRFASVAVLQAFTN
jgi:hypothetical protein